MAPILRDLESQGSGSQNCNQLDPIGLIPLIQLVLMPFIPLIELLVELMYKRYAAVQGWFLVAKPPCYTP